MAKGQGEYGMLDHVKFANVVLFFLKRCPGSGSTKLLKLLYLADAEHYQRTLSSITGGQYVALERGPVLNDYKKLFKTLEHGAVIKAAEARVYGVAKPKQEYLPQHEPNLAVFTHTELDVLQDTAEKWGASCGVDLSEQTHRDGPWSWVWDRSDPGRNIPFGLLRWMENMSPKTEKDVAAARAALKRAPVQKTLHSLRTRSRAA